MKKKEQRLQKLQSVADDIMDKLKLRVASLEPMEMNPQTLKHITGVLKDLKDIQTAGSGDTDCGKITVVFTGELEEYSG